MNYRSERLTKVFEEELSRIIERELEFPGAIVTITSVQFSDKLEHANIGFSVFPSEKAEESLETLNENKFELRRTLAKKVTMKTMPQIDFKIDHGSENAAVVEKLLIDDNNK
ncbi:MAG: ribosome-binding factor A [Parcubacteria group bacterium Gr01-1014_20]|nr:MAG: ribosome-binding factor A [Parcubacteria group bacterium Gr01-1014_20]